MKAKKIDANHDLITLVWGKNQTGRNRTHVLLELSQVLTENSLSVLETDLKTRRGWFRLEIISQLKGNSELDFHTLDKRLKEVVENIGFKVENDTILQKNVPVLEGDIIIVTFGEDKVGTLERILHVVDKYEASVVNMESSIDKENKQFALKLYTRLPVTKSRFKTIEDIRNGLRGIEKDIGKNKIYTMVHHEKTFRFLQQIDYERGNDDEG